MSEFGNPEEHFLLSQMVAMGFDQKDCEKALKMTGNKSIDLAIDWLSQQPNDSNKEKKSSTGSVQDSSKGKGKEIEKEAIKDAAKFNLQLNQEKQAKKRSIAVSMSSNDDDYEYDENEYDEEEDGDDDDDDDLDMGVDNEADYYDEYKTEQVLDKKAIQQGASKEIERVANIIDISISAAGALLKHFHWNSEKLLERFYEDPSKVLKEAGIATQSVIRSSNTTTSTSSTNARMTVSDCIICGDRLVSGKSSGLECGHKFCNDCWKGYLNTQITDGKSIGITCMGHKCATLVTEDIVKAVVDPPIFSKYVEFITKSVVEDNPNIQWCPRPGCQNAVKSDFAKTKDVRCKCGFKFCFQCNGESHSPADCDMMKKWEKKCKDDSETCNWISSNTQDCIKCKSAIEKNGGCNHMTCRKCGEEFCWICLGQWKGHTQCNKYTASNDNKKTESRAALDRYLHYFHRYTVHEESKKFEGKLWESVNAKMRAIQDTDPSRLVDVQYVFDATEQLIECRRTLKYTYVFGFYLEEGPEKQLFNFLQSDLEATTESLSHLLENLIGKDPKQLKDLTHLAKRK
eukprot:TRINITY_DN8658_c0_g2_i2.p1 TRINITY_DN8658_c0_g2~~TRINITY_DN8658_c0_g2_i2.p1  ORF type:complete len:571 (+),score=108.81 TRINITY_DN8658_c0_g2_i2:228-1940(+)